MEFTSGRRRDGADRFDAEDAGKRKVRTQPLACGEIQAIEPARLHADQHLPCPRDWHRPLLDLENLHAARPTSDRGLHGQGAWGASHPDPPW
jgi:hypothetical protein